MTGSANEVGPRPRRSLRQRGVKRNYCDKREWRKRALLRVLDFPEHILLLAASGVSSGKEVLEAVRRLLGATGDVMVILETLRSLVATADLPGISQQKSDVGLDTSGKGEAAFMATAPYSQGYGSGLVSLRSRTLQGSIRGPAMSGVGTSSHVRCSEGGWMRPRTVAAQKGSTRH